MKYLKEHLRTHNMLNLETYGLKELIFNPYTGVHITGMQVRMGENNQQCETNKFT